MDILVSPRDAFQIIRSAAPFLLALAIVLLLSAVGYELSLSAHRQILTRSLEASATFRHLSHERQQSFISVQIALLHAQTIVSVVMALVKVLAYGIMLFIGALLLGGKATYRQTLSLAANAGIVGIGLNAVVNGLILTLRGSDSINSYGDIITSIPSLAWLAPHAQHKLVAFLFAFTPLSMWMLALFGWGLVTIAGVPRLSSYLWIVTSFALVTFLLVLR